MSIDSGFEIDSKTFGPSCVKLTLSTMKSCLRTTIQLDLAHICVTFSFTVIRIFLCIINDLHKMFQLFQHCAKLYRKISMIEFAIIETLHEKMMKGASFKQTKNMYIWQDNPKHVDERKFS